MSFEIKPSGAAVAIAIEAAETVSLLKSGFCERLDALLPAYARDPEIYGMVLTAIPALVASGEAATFEERLAGARLAWRLECYSKPTVSLIDGPLSGYLAGLVLAGTHRVAGDGYLFRAVPDDVLSATDGGLVHWLAHLTGGFGAYLAATGRSIGPREALRFGLVTHVIPAARFAEIEAGMTAADPVDPLLDDRHAAPAATPADQALDRLIESCFAVPRLDAIRSRLAAVAGPDPTAAAILADVEATASASRLEEALAVIERASRADMRSTLIASFAVANPAYPAVELPTRAQHQALRNR